MQEESLILYPKKGLGKVRIGKTSEEEIKTLFGSNYQLEEQIYEHILKIDGQEKSRLDTPYHYVNYPNLGLRFYFRNQDQQLIRIIAFKNFQGRTLKNIRLQHSTMGETLKYYGKPQRINSKEEIVYAYKGIAFVGYCICDTLSEQEINRLPIKEIVIAKSVKLARVIHIQ